MSVQFKSVEPRLAPPSRGQHAGPVVLDVPDRRNSVIIRSKRPSGQAGASLALRALRKRKSAARRVGRAALAPHRAPGAQAVRVICFSCGRTRPETIFQAPMRRDERPAGTSRGAARPPRARAVAGGWASHAACAAIAQPAHPDRARVAHAAPIGRVQVLLARTHPCQTMPARRRAAGHRPTGRQRAATVCPRLAHALRSVLAAPRGVCWTSGRGFGPLACTCTVHTAHCTPVCACKPGRFRSWCFLRNPTVQRARRLIFS